MPAGWNERKKSIKDMVMSDLNGGELKFNNAFILFENILNKSQKFHWE